MTTTTILPVIVGTVVEVSCKPGYTLTGDNTITCVKDVSFNIDQRPICTIGSIFVSDYISYVSLTVGTSCFIFGIHSQIQILVLNC